MKFVAVFLLCIFSPFLLAEAKILRVQVGSEIETLDPQLAAEAQFGNIARTLFMGLFDYDHKTNIVAKDLVTNFSHNKNYTHWIFHIRKDIWWVSSKNQQIVKERKLSASDILFSFQRVLQKKTSPFADYFFIIKNAQQIYEGTNLAIETLGIKVIDENTLEITTEKPCPSLLDYLNHHAFRIIPPEIILNFPETWMQPQNLWSSGPYILKEWKLKSHISVIKNPFYPKASEIQIDEIWFYFLGGSSPEALRAFEAGEIDIDLTGIASTHLERIKKRGVVHISKKFRTNFLEMNLKQWPFSDKRVRLALSLAIPRKDIVKYITKSGQKEAYSFLPLDFPHYKPVMIPYAEKTKKEQLAYAKELLRQAGFSAKNPFPSCVINYVTSPVLSQILQVIRKSWKEHLGVDCTLENQESKIFLNFLKEKKFQINLSAWAIQGLDPIYFLERMLSHSANNYSGFNNTQYDHLVSKMRSLPISSQRRHLVHQADKILMQDLPLLPIYFSTNIDLVQPYIQNFYSTPFAQHSFWKVKMLPSLSKNK
ncbi:MAG: peptide ABC transporter substrate-binding protein [Bacteriovoracaceae bacterium]|nr:peptide ABC transporter substrate-binding protein [Bacteriovoracaceae bacterium]